MKSLLRQSVVMFSTVAVVVVLASSAFAVTPPPLVKAPGAIAAPPANIPSTIPKLADNPIIKSFTVSPGNIVQGDAIYVSWNITHGVGGSPIQPVTIARDGVMVLANGPSVQSSFPLSTPSAVGTNTLTLTARNAAGNISTQTANFTTISANQAWANISIENMDASPIQFAVGQPVDLKVLVKNTNPGVTVKGVNIFVTSGARVVANQTDVSLAPGSPTWLTLRDNGFVAPSPGGVYKVELQYKGGSKIKNFITVPTTLYTIAPGP